jgi:hypothetical protein
VDVSKLGKWKHDLFDVLCSRVDSGDTRVSQMNGSGKAVEGRGVGTGWLSKGYGLRNPRSSFVLKCSNMCERCVRKCIQAGRRCGKLFCDRCIQ